jgi:hypothetical protein
VRGKTVSGTLAQVLDRDPGIDWRDLYTWVLCLGQGNARFIVSALSVTSDHGTFPLPPVVTRKIRK